MARKKKNPTPFYVLCRSFIGRDKIKPYNVMPYLIETYDDHKKSKWRKTPQTFEEFKTFVNEVSLYQYWGRCEYEFLLAHWPFGSKKMTEGIMEFMKTNPDLKDHKQNIDFYNIILSEMDKIDVYEQIKMNLDVVTRLLMENLGIKEETKKKKKKNKDENKSIQTDNE